MTDTDKTRLNPQGRVAPLGAFAWRCQRMSDTPDTSAQKDVANRPNPALPRADSIRAFFDFLHLQ